MFKLVERLGSRVIGGVAAGFIAALAMGATAVAITDTQFLYSSTKTGYFTIHAMAVAPNTNLANYTIHYTEGAATTQNDSCFSTGVNLPQGSRITQLLVWYTSAAADNPFVYFERIRLTDGSGTSLIPSGTIADNSDTRKLAVIPIVGGSSPVSNIGFSYGFGICPGTDGSFRGARIAYTYTSAGD